MAEFSFTALSPAGVRSSGTVTASCEREAMSIIDARGLYPVQITAAQSAARRWGFGGRVRARHMATFYSQLADLLKAGVPLLRSLDILERMGAQANLQIALRDVRTRVADGSSLAQAMAQHPKVFDELAVSMVRAGQEGGFLEDVLKRIADFTEHQEDLKAEVVGAMAYPVFLAVVGFLVLNGLIIFFIPRFEPIFAKLRDRGQLPSLTVWLIAVSHFMWPWGLMIVVGLFLGIVAFRIRGMSPAVRYTYDRLKLRVPGAGRIFLNLGLSRFTRILGTLLHNGIPILRSL
jgi:general secretion pathway protein F/type IV pilus assembly protein PilC